MKMSKYLQKIKRFLSKGTHVGALKDEKNAPCIYIFSIEKKADINIEKIKRRVILNPWSLNSPKIISLHDAFHIEVSVLNNAKGSLLEADIMSSLLTKKQPK